MFHYPNNNLKRLRVNAFSIFCLLLLPHFDTILMYLQKAKKGEAS